MNPTAITPLAIEDAFAAIPAEVEDFMWSDTYRALIDAISTTLALTDEQKKLVTLKSYELLLGTVSMEKIAADFITAGFSQELTAKTLFLLTEEVLPQAKYITESYLPDPDEPQTGETGTQETLDMVSAPSPADVLASLKEKMTAPAAIAPSVRETAAPTNLPLEKSTAPRIDPYRELPE